MATALPIEVQWGHPLLTPDGRLIRVTASTFPLLRKLGVLARNKPVLSGRIYDLLNPEYDSLAPGLRQLLGRDLTGPAWLVCTCRACKERGCDNVRLPGQMVPETEQIVAEAISKRNHRAGDNREHL